jgi:hypothetical protein
MLKFDYVDNPSNKEIIGLPIVSLDIINYQAPSKYHRSNYALIDTGSDITLVSYSIISKIQAQLVKKSQVNNRADPIKTIDKDLDTTAYFLKLGFDSIKPTKIKVYAVKDEKLAALNCEVLIGRDVLKKYVVTFDGLQSKCIIHLPGFIDSYLRLNPTEQKQFQIEASKIKLPQERENIMEITTSWKEEGRVEGRAEGRVEGQRALAIKLLTCKLGNLSPELLARLNGLSLDRVEALAEELLDFTSVGDLEVWLAR